MRSSWRRSASGPAGWDSCSEQDHVVGGAGVGDLGSQLLEQGGEGLVGRGSGQSGGGTVDGSVYVITTSFNQSVGVEQQRRPGGQETLLAGARAAGHAGPKQPIMYGAALVQDRCHVPPPAGLRWACTRVPVASRPRAVQAFSTAVTAAAGPRSRWSRSAWRSMLRTW